MSRLGGSLGVRGPTGDGGCTRRGACVPQGWSMVCRIDLGADAACSPPVVHLVSLRTTPVPAFLLAPPRLTWWAGRGQPFAPAEGGRSSQPGGWDCGASRPPCYLLSGLVPSRVSPQAPTWDTCQRDYSAPLLYPLPLPSAPFWTGCDGSGGGEGTRPVVRAPVRAAGGVSGDGDLLGAGVEVGGAREKQSRSPQNLPGRGGWSWVGQAEPFQVSGG